MQALGQKLFESTGTSDLKTAELMLARRIEEVRQAQFFGVSGVPLETRKALLGHRNGDITSHYSAAELEELISAANRVCEGKSGTGGTASPATLVTG